MRKHNLFWGVLFILVGALFMLNNLGVFNINVWKLLWPSFLIALGVWTIWATQPGQAAREVEQVVIPLDGAGQARVRIRYGAGRLRVGGGTGADELATGGFAGGLDYKTARAGETLEVDMRSPSADSPVVFIPWAWGPRDWNFSLNDQIPLSLDIKSGGSDIQLNLTGLRVTDLKLDTGASTTDIYLPANAGHTQVKVSGGATTINIRVPQGVAARIQVRGGLNTTTIDRNRFPRSEGVYQSSNYETAENKTDINVDIGVGTVDIR